MSDLLIDAVGYSRHNQQHQTSENEKNSENGQCFMFHWYI